MIDCAVLGAGFAGLTAATRLAQAGRHVLVLEAKPHAGGRAHSFRDRETGTELDNGQHLMMGCYSATRRFLHELGTEEKLLRIAPLRIPFRHADGRSSELRIGRLPHPLGVVQGFLGYGLLSWGDRLSALRVASVLRRIRPEAIDSLDGTTVARWLDGLGQSANAREALWRPIVLATMNNDIDDASAKLFVVVLREIFLSGAEASTLLMPAVGLSSLYVDAAASLLRRLGGGIECSTRVESVSRDPDGAFTIRRRNAEPVRAGRIISAIPPQPLKRVLTASNLDALVPGLEMFTPSEIVSVHVQTSAPITQDFMTGLLGTVTQWLFRKESERPDRYRYSCTISFAHPLGLSAAEFEARVVTDLCALIPGMHPRVVVAARAIRERSGTFIPSPGMESHRPGPVTALKDFFLAGDWTNTGLPATIESATRSGFAAAEAVLAT